MYTPSPTYRFLLASVILVVTLSGGSALAVEDVPSELDGVTVNEQLGEQVDLNLEFVDHNGATVRLGDYFDGERPVILTMNYYRCPMLCGLQLNALIAGLGGVDWSAGDEFQILTVSISPDEGTDLASGKHESTLRALNREGAEWHFLTGDEAEINALAEQVGYGFRYIEENGEYAHPAAIMFLSPDGTVNRYLTGLQYTAQDVRFALIEAAEGRVGSPIDQIILSCFRYDPDAGSYVPFAFGIMRVGGSLFAIALGLLLLALWRRDKKSHKAEVTA